MFSVICCCALVVLIGACFLWFGYQNLLWKYYEYIFVKNLKKYEGEKQ